MSEEDMPNFPISKQWADMIQAAATMWDFFQSFKDAGFNDEQALELVKAIVGGK